MLATRRHSLHQTQIHIAIQGQGQRTRNRGCRHGQEMNGVTTFGKLPALAYTKTMLLINNSQTEFGKAHILGNQGMGADHDLDIAICKAFQHIPSDPGPHTAVQQVYFNAHGLKEFVKAVYMLCGKHLGRSHDGALKIILASGQHAEGCYPRFSGTHITLQ